MIGLPCVVVQGVVFVGRVFAVFSLVMIWLVYLRYLLIVGCC